MECRWGAISSHAISQDKNADLSLSAMLAKPDAKRNTKNAKREQGKMNHSEHNSLSSFSLCTSTIDTLRTVERDIYL